MALHYCLAREIYELLREGGFTIEFNEKMDLRPSDSTVNEILSLFEEALKLLSRHLRRCLLRIIVLPQTEISYRLFYLVIIYTR